MGWFSVFSRGNKAGKQPRGAVRRRGQSDSAEEQSVSTSAAAEPSQRAPGAGPVPSHAAAAEQGPAVAETVRHPPPRAAGGPSRPPAPREGNVSLAQMYDAWVELEGTIGSAHEGLRTMLSNRRSAAAAREQAQEVLGQAEAAWEEARRLGDAAWKAFDRGFTANLPGVAERLRTIREIDEARKAQAELQRASNNEAWEEADRARQKATAGLLKALTSFTAAAAQVERELREAENLSGVAESLRNSALEDLRCAQAIEGELSTLGQKALDQLQGRPATAEARREERLTGEPAASRSGPQREAAAAARATPEVSPGEEVSPSDSSGLGAPGDIEGSVVGFKGAVEAPPAEIGPVESAPMSAAEKLRREFEAAASFMGVGAPGIGAPEDTAPRAAGTPSPGVSAPPAKGNAVPGAAAETYSGRLYLMLPSSLGPGEMESVWETLEEATGPGSIVDTRLVSADAGVQFTLDLGSRVFSIGELRKRMPGARLEALGPDRLKVHWPR